MDKHHIKCRHCGVLVSRKKLQNHIKKFHASAETKGQIPESQWLKVMQLLEYSPKKGFEFLRRLEVTYPPNVDVYYNMGVALLHLGRFEEAERYFGKTLRLEADHEYARGNLDLLVRIRKIFNKEHAEADLEDMGTLANDARDAGLFDLAKRIANIMVEVDKGPGALNDLGLTFQDQKEFDKALECYDRALKIDPNMREALSNKACCLMLTNKLDESHRLYERLIELNPDFLQGWYHLGFINIKKENYTEALNYLDKAIELNDEYYLAWFAKHKALAELKRTEEAKQCWEKVVDLNPEYAMQLAFGEVDDVHTTNMHAKPRKNV